MVPVPSYPLFDHLTALDGVRSIPYPLDYHGRWTLAPGDVDDALDAGSPGGPGRESQQPDWLGVVRRGAGGGGGALRGASGGAHSGRGLCRLRIGCRLCWPKCRSCQHNSMLAGPHPRSLSRGDCAPRSGRRRSSDVPAWRALEVGRAPPGQAWMDAVDGPDDLVHDAIERLELICDTYLSVSTPVQVAAPKLIAGGALVRAQILDRVRANYGALLTAVARHPAIEVLHADAGWSAVLRVPSTRSEEDLVVDLLGPRRRARAPGILLRLRARGLHRRQPACPSRRCLPTEYAGCWSEPMPDRAPGDIN